MANFALYEQERQEVQYVTDGYAAGGDERRGQ